MTKNATILTIRCSKDDINKLKEIARKRAYENKKDVMYTDIIREAISEKIKKEL